MNSDLEDPLDDGADGPEQADGIDEEDIDDDDPWDDYGWSYESENPGNLPFDAVEAVKAWRIEAVGHRPEDFLMRDVLHSALLRDARCRWFSNWRKHPAAWMAELASQLPAADESAALQHLALHYMHRRRLLRLLCPRIPSPGVEGEVRARLLFRLWECEPCGVLLHRDDTSSDEPSADDVRRDKAAPRPRYRRCGHVRLCPWCQARAVRDLHFRLQHQVRRGGPGRYLVMGRVRCDSEGMVGDPPELREERFMREVGYSGTGAWAFAGWADAYYREQWGNNFKQAGRIGGVFRRKARYLGVTSGLHAHFVSHFPRGTGRPEFLHEFVLLGEVRLPTEAAVAGFWQELVETAGIGTDGGREVSPVGGRVSWWLAPAEHPQALRLLLAGSSLSYPVENLGLRLAAGYAEDDEHNGIRGALGLRPTYLFNDFCWWAHECLMRGVPIYRTFGNWRNSQRCQRIMPAADSVAAWLIRDSGPNPEHPYQVRRARRLDLLARAQALWPSVVSRPVEGRGRPPRGRWLQEGLLAQGQTVTERELRWLLKRLGKEQESPASSDRSPASSDRSPASSDRSPASPDRSPASPDLPSPASPDLPVERDGSE